ncbi:MAG: argininosuccinate lyase, partial [Thermoleophilaceae bacterium]|nr:argininosuccinate lyase [Thermoleophilaceae bacterium]
MRLWAARVGASLAPEVEAFLRGDDAELLPYDCAATVVHARRLQAAGLLSDAELAEVESKIVDLEWEPGDEDVHTLIERKLGGVGRKIHAGRSRNDQVAAAFRLYVVDACDEASAKIRSFADVLLERAATDAETPMPGYTHLQRAQPVTVGHHLLAWVEMLERDRERFRFAATQTAALPLGAG